MSQDIVGPLNVTSALGIQGGSLELGATLGATPEAPYLDFHFGIGFAQDYNVRLINAANNRLDFVTEAGGPVWSMNMDKIGIGTTTPAAKLVVQDAFGGVELRVEGNNGAQGLSLGADASHPWVGTRTNHDLRILTNNTEQMRVQASGHVGIGTSTPQEKLDINGRVKSSALSLGAWPANGVYMFVGVNTLDQSQAGNYALLQLATGNGTGTTFLNSPVDIHFRIGNNEKMVLENNGDLTVAGNAFKPGGGAWGVSSDIRRKQNVQPLQGALDTLLRLRGITFEWKEPEQQGNLTGLQMGLLAHEVEAVFPEWISTDPEGYKQLTVRGFEALVVEAMRTLKAETDQMTLQHHVLEARVVGLEAKLRAQELTHGGHKHGVAR